MRKWQGKGRATLLLGSKHLTSLVLLEELVLI